ncbi:hypothetical protein MtrunA17_Chr8g0342141 [Medicago truncatula]|uniref:Uncharacterized protein n=1 Tax=Medicago truncatula TaxID=3880 RepID=A0A396GDJ1_MEDTR|nr:hypothetical protein MtrunA17_Chr8g0342141 [Medicago truncatula]
MAIHSSLKITNDDSKEILSGISYKIGISTMINSFTVRKAGPEESIFI